MSDAEHARFAEWDGAYVLGALTPSDRHAYEEHLEDCAQCRGAVAELAPMPGLLAQIRPDLLDARADGSAGSTPGPAATEAERDSAAEAERTSTGLGHVVPLRPVGHAVPRGHEPGRAATADPPSTSPDGTRPRRRRLLAGSLVAAAALVLAIALPSTLGDRGDAEFVTVSPSALGGAPAPMRVDVELVPQAWGTAMTITCDYPPTSSEVGPGPVYGGPGATPSYALIVTAEDGSRSQVSSWQGVPGEVVTLEAGTAVDFADIASVAVVDPAGTTVLAAEVGGP